VPPIQALPLDRTIPLSFAQQRLWFLQQLDPRSTEYNITTARKFIGPLNISALEQSLAEIIHRQASLRTTFPVIAGQPIQSIAPSIPFSLTTIDLAAFTDEEREAAVQQHAREEAQRPFDLAAGPLLRATLFHLADNEHVLLFSMHHIISDRWSMEVFFSELSTLYTAFSTHQPSPLPALAIQYADLATWQHDWLQGEILDQDVAYWRQQLNDAPPVLTLPTDHPRLPVQTHRGAHQRTHFPLSLTQALHELSRQEGTTLFMTMLAAFQVLLCRYTGQDDIAVGSPTANRTHVETEQLIGFFVNMLVLRTNVSGNPTFRELLQRVREVVLGAYAHQAIPFEKLVEELRPERTLNYSPLFQVVFHHRNVLPQAAEFPGIRTEVLRYESGSAQFDLTLALRETAEGLEVEAEYVTDLFEETTITRLIGHYRTLLEGIVNQPDKPIATLPLLSRQEEQQILIDWNNTTRDDFPDTCLHNVLEAQGEKAPDAVAVVFDKRWLTYRELNNKANQLAHYLQKLGVGPEVFVGVCVERSLELLVGLLGVVKAGAAYVPLDPDLPQDRLTFMLKDSGVRVLLTQTALLQKLPDCPAQLVCLDSDWRNIAGESTTPPVTEVTPDNLAYVIYTSGSAGTPKGALNTHRGICNQLRLMQETYRLSETDRVLQKTPYSFDASIWEILWPLMAGATAVLAHPQEYRDPRYLVRLIIEQQITVLFFVPSMLGMFLEVADVEKCHSLRQIICGGEALTLELQQRFFRRLPARLDNWYGPTEAAIAVAYWACKRDDTRETLPIGRPTANTQIYLLDEYLQPVPVGIPGELHIGGVQVGRGYLNRPGLTAEKFIPDPFSGRPEARLYRTGDLARYLPDGSMEFLGRIDNQVKIRGYRIELGEVEAVLAQHASVREAVVTTREDASGDQHLIAYLIPHTLARITEDVRAYLKAKLPPYMVPSAFVFLEAFPLTPNGKIDRKALPAPTQSLLEAGHAYVAPRTPIEETVAGIWSEVLGVQQVGVYDNFFALGGHSLRAMQFINRVRSSFAVELPLRSLFGTPTVADLATAIDAVSRMEKPSAEPASSLIPLQPDGTRPPFFGVPGHNGDVFCYLALAQKLGPEHPFYGLQPPGTDGKRPPLTDVKELAAYFVNDIRRFRPEGPYLVGGYCLGGIIAFEIAQQLRSAGQEVALLALFGTQSPTALTVSHRIRRRSWRYAQRMGNWMRMLWHSPLREHPRYVLEKIQQRQREKEKHASNLLHYPHRPYVEQATVKAAHRYQPERYAGRISLFIPNPDPRSLYNSRFLEWQTLTTAPFDSEVGPPECTSDMMLREPYVQIFAELLRTRLDQIKV